MPCPFYGKHAIPLMRALIDQHGNQCALITGAYAPCRMELAGASPDLEKCEFAGSDRAIEFAEFRQMPANTRYPD
jgi:hypothetical protein